ncbi:MAG TPA: GTPase [Isosphaeraceae bacterium]|jgi:tRNA modification GTPase|nr:GTPase [Isosphaeraceae bacterium]
MIRAGAAAGVLTPGGVGAVAVVWVWGLEAVAVADAAFRPVSGRGLAVSDVGRLRVGRIGAGLGDEVVAVVVRGGWAVEVHCHGGPAAVALVLEALRAAGAEILPAGVGLRECEGSYIRAEAFEDLARAPTVRVAEILLDQADYALGDELDRIEKPDPPEALEAIDRLLARAKLGLRMLEGWRVALAGRPNVGKSSLLNALAGFERAIVAESPGTTRDVVTARTALGGWPVVLADTAGLREAIDPVEAAGVSRAEDEHAAADLVVLVLDRSEPLTGADRRLLAGFPDALVVANKCDLPAAWDAGDWPSVSAGRGDGLDALAVAIVARLVPDPPPPGAAVPFRARHVEVLSQHRARRID